MKFTMQDFIADVLASEMTDEQKATFLAQVVETGRICPGFYLKKHEDNTYECWYRNVDESGLTSHGPTNYTPERIIQEYLYSLGRKL